MCGKKMSILDKKIEEAKTICILGHKNPDGDCIGSTLSLYNYIQNKYSDKIVKPYLEEFSEKFLILPNADKIRYDLKDATKFDLCIVVDSSNVDRFKDFQHYFDEAKDTIVIDHHENNMVPAKTSILFPESIATCEILYEFLDKKYIDINVAMCLYVGLATDSGVFRYKATTKKTLEIAGLLIDYGFDFTKLLDTIVFNNSLNQRKAQGIAFERLKLICKGQVSFSYLDDDDLEKLKLQKNDIDNVIVYLREMDNVKVASFAYQVGNNIFKLSLRSNDYNVNVAEFAMKHDGGGHMLAAGCMYYGSIEDVKKNFEEDMGNYIAECEDKK